MPAVFGGALLELIVCSLHVVQIFLLPLVLYFYGVELVLGLFQKILSLVDIGALGHNNAGQNDSVHSQQDHKVYGAEICPFGSLSFFHSLSIADYGLAGYWFLWIF